MCAESSGKSNDEEGSVQTTSSGDLPSNISKELVGRQFVSTLREEGLYSQTVIMSDSRNFISLGILLQ